MVQQKKRSQRKDQRPKDMEIKKPEHFDFERANEVATKVMRENQKWLEEMAKK